MGDPALSYAADRLDPPAQPSHAEWCRDELGHHFTTPFGPHQLWLFGLIGHVARGVRAFLGAPRGSGKSAAALFGIPLAAIALRTHRFIVIVAATQDDAEARLELIRGELERNGELAERWPALRFARRRFTRKEIANRSREILLEGGRIVALGAGGKIRGILRRSASGQLARPDLVIGDDLEDAEQARSKLRTDRLEEWLFSDVSNLGANMRATFAAPMDLVVIGTTIDVDAMATRAIKRKGRFGSWQTKAFPAEYVDADGVRRAMWPEGQPLELLDELLDPRFERFLGAFTYAKEYKLDPLDRADSAVKRAAILHGKVPRRQDGSIDLRFVWFGVDPAASEDAFKGNDPSAIVGVGLDRLNRVWVFRAWRGWVSSDRLFDVAGGFVDDVPDSSVAYEGVAGFKWGVQELRKRKISHRAVQPTSDKLSRFQPVALLYESNLKGLPAIIHDETLAETTFEEELVGFPTADHDDFVDGLYLAVKASTNDFRLRAREAPAA